MKKVLRYSLLLTALTLAMASCQKDDTDMDDIIAEYQVEPVEVELDFSALTEAPDVLVTDENDSAFNNYVENSPWNKVIGIAFDGENAPVTGDPHPHGGRARTARDVALDHLHGPLDSGTPGIVFHQKFAFDLPGHDHTLSPTSSR